MLGCEPVIRYESVGAGAQSDLTREIPVCLGGSPDEPAAVDVDIAAPALACAGLAHQPGIPPTVAASKVTSTGAATRSMMSSNRPRPGGAFEFSFHGCDNRSQRGGGDRPG